MPTDEPCPFCAGDNLVTSSNEMDVANVVCNGCGAEGPVHQEVGATQNRLEAGAWRLWNRRPGR